MSCVPVKGQRYVLGMHYLFGIFQSEQWFTISNYVPVVEGNWLEALDPAFNLLLKRVVTPHFGFLVLKCEEFP
tara:strand:- start:199 stop:417 length:219 start_codon:yes stop_codon:yes gene_type:complete